MSNTRLVITALAAATTSSVASVFGMKHVSDKAAITQQKAFEAKLAAHQQKTETQLNEMNETLDHHAEHITDLHDKQKSSSSTSTAAQVAAFSAIGYGVKSLAERTSYDRDGLHIAPESSGCVIC